MSSGPPGAARPRRAPAGTIGYPAAMSDAVARGFQALNRYFDRVVVLTLRRASDRHASVQRVLAGLEHELFFGRDKQELNLEELTRANVYDPARARRLHRQSREMTLGHVACVMSHMEIWRSIVGGQGKRVLVLEDDAIPDPRAMAAAPDILGQLPADWDLVYLGYDRNEPEKVTLRRRLDQLTYVGLGALGLIRYSAREARNLLPRPFSANLRRAGLHDQTHAYALTPPAAERLLAFQRPIALNVDTGIARVVLRGELEAFVATPKLFHQDQTTMPSYVGPISPENERSAPAA